MYFFMVLFITLFLHKINAQRDTVDYDRYQHKITISTNFLEVSFFPKLRKRKLSHSEGAGAVIGKNAKFELKTKK